MTNTELKDRIADALAQDGPLAALTVLRLAADWASQTLGDACGGDDVLAFQAVAALDDALTGVGSLERAVPALVEAASPGAPVHEHLRERQAVLARTREELASDRTALETLGATERDLAEQVAEHDRLRDRVAELRRLRRLADEVDDLHAQHDALRAEIDAMAPTAEQAERAVADASDRLLHLTEEQLARLAPDVRRALEDADAAHTELAELRAQRAGAEERIEADRAELASASEGFESLRRRHEEVLNPLRAYQQADRELATALARDEGPSLTKESGLARAQNALDEVEQRLNDVDDILGRVMAEHARVHEEAHTVLGWSG
ncbi:MULTISPECIES: hypothetical protein [Actinomadura]|uniref:Chromosome partition protein Smc n=1 Tax=Actinomadura yumaensis TaxID=111807 RepID=A0ABW2CEL6_9ACTN|nr:hypothetical protein [Actinomadura sp. J1-007]MWK34657.1 hypothetical protein [Actinomadura sp. J1-007]